MDRWFKAWSWGEAKTVASGEGPGAGYCMAWVRGWVRGQGG